MIDIAKHIKVKTLIIGGENDFIDPNDFKLITNTIIKSELVILPNGPHFPMWSHPEEYFNAIDKFLISINN